MDNPTKVSSSLQGFLAGHFHCYAHFSFEAARGLGVTKAAVLMNPAAMTEEQQRRCFLISTAIALGIPRPIGMVDGPNPLLEDQDAWKRTETLNLLCLYVLYHLDDKTVQGTRQDVEAALSDLLHEMRINGN